MPIFNYNFIRKLGKIDQNKNVGKSFENDFFFNRIFINTP